MTKAQIAGGLVFNQLLGTTKHDRVLLSGSVSAGLHKVLKLTGTASLQQTAPFVGLGNWARVSGKFAAFGASTNTTASFVAGSNGLPKQIDLAGSGTLKVPAPGGTYTLGSGAYSYRYSPKATTAAASGKLAIPFSSVSMGASISTSGAYTFTGNGAAKLYGYTLGSGKVSFSNAAGARIKGTLAFPFYGSFDGAISPRGNTYFGSTIKIGRTTLGLSGYWRYWGCVNGAYDKHSTGGCYNLKSGQAKFWGQSTWQLTSSNTLTFGANVKTSGTKLTSLGLTGGGNFKLPGNFSVTSFSFRYDEKYRRVCFKGALFSKSFSEKCLYAPGSWSVTTGADVKWDWYISALPYVYGKALVNWTGKVIAASSYISFGYLGFKYKGTAQVDSAAKVTRFNSKTSQSLKVIYSVTPSFKLGSPKWCKSCCCTTIKCCKKWSGPICTSWGNCKTCVDGYCGAKPVSVSWSTKTATINGYMELDVDKTKWSHRWCGTSDYSIVKTKGKCVAVGSSRKINLCASPFNLPLNFSFKDPWFKKSYGYNACTVGI